MVFNNWLKSEYVKEVAKFWAGISGPTGPERGPKFRSEFLQLFFRSYSFGLRNLEVICLFESDFILKF